MSSSSIDLKKAGSNHSLTQLKSFEPPSSISGKYDVNSKLFWEAIHKKDMTITWGLLLEGGINPNVRDTDGNDGLTPLHAASQDGDVALAMLLVSKGADFNLRDNMGQTPLHKGAMCGHLQIVTLLVKAGAKTDILDKMDRTAEELAFQHNNMQIFRFLISLREDGIKEMNKPGEKIKEKQVAKREGLIRSITSVSKKQVVQEDQRQRREREKEQRRQAEIQDKIEILLIEKERLQSIPEKLQSKRDKLGLTQVLNKLEKLNTQSEKSVRRLNEDGKGNVEVRSGLTKAQRRLSWLTFGTYY